MGTRWSFGSKVHPNELGSINKDKSPLGTGNPSWDGDAALGSRKIHQEQGGKPMSGMNTALLN